MKLVSKKDIYIGNIYESLEDSKTLYNVLLNRFYMLNIMPDGVLKKENAKLIKLKYHDAYIDVEDKNFNTLNMLYIKFYEERKSVNDFVSLLLKEPKLKYIYKVPSDKGDLYATNLKKYYDKDDNKKISIKKTKRL